MSKYAYNPFTSNLDIAGSESYIDDVVATPASLPVTVGTPALDSVYLAKAGSGLWLISRRPAGLYCRTANNGVAADWTHLGAFPEVNADGNWELYNTADPTKELKFDLSGIATGVTRTLSVPNSSGTIALTSGTTFTNLTAAPTSGSALTLTGGTVTASAPVLDATQTWNDAANIFVGLRFTATNTASNLDSDLMQLRVGATNMFKVRRDGAVAAADSFLAGGAFMQSNSFRAGSAGNLTFSSGSGGVSGSLDTTLSREAAGVFRMTAPAAGAAGLLLYNTTTTATNYERGFMRWSSNVLQIGTEKAGTGSARALEFQTDGTTRMTLPATSNIVSFSLGLSVPNNGEYRFGSSAVRIMGASSSPQYITFQTGATDRLVLNDTLLGFGGTTSSFPALKRSTTTLQVRLADDTAFAPFACAGLTLNGNLDASTRDLVTDTTTGTKIGTGTTQLLGFWNATPVAQQSSTGTAATGFTANGPTNTVHADSTFTGNVGATAYTISDIVKHLKTIGLIAS